ncbi:MAG: excisionase family DNA-binding protein [Dehalococcoidia bacterium]
MTGKGLMTLVEAAQFLGVGRTKLFELIREEQLPVVRLGPRLVRVQPERLSGWVAARESGPGYEEVA